MLSQKGIFWVKKKKIPISFISIRYQTSNKTHILYVQQLNICFIQNQDLLSIKGCSSKQYLTSTQRGMSNESSAMKVVRFSIKRTRVVALLGNMLVREASKCGWVKFNEPCTYLVSNFMQTPIKTSIFPQLRIK